MAKHSAHILDLARRGAETRFGELIDEAKRWFNHSPISATRSTPTNCRLRSG